MPLQEVKKLHWKKLFKGQKDNQHQDFSLLRFKLFRQKYPQLDPAVITQLVTGGISISDLALGIGDMEDIQSILDEVLTATTQSDVVELD